MLLTAALKQAQAQVMLAEAQGHSEIPPFPQRDRRGPTAQVAQLKGSGRAGTKQGLDQANLNLSWTVVAGPPRTAGSPKRNVEKGYLCRTRPTDFSRSWRRKVLG